MNTIQEWSLGLPLLIGEPKADAWSLGLPFDRFQETEYYEISVYATE